MNRITWAMALTIVQIVATPSSAAGVPAGASPQSLSDAVALAWSRAPAAATQPHRRSEVDALARLAAGWAPGPPVVAVSTTGDRLLAATGMREWALEIATPLWQRGQREAQQAEALASRISMEARERLEQLELAGQVRAAWWAVVAARDSVALLDQRLASARALQEDVERRWRAGDLARTDVNTAKAETQSVLSERIDAEREVRRAETEWLALVGSPAPAQLPDETLASPSPAMNAHPALRSVEAAVALAQAQLRVADRRRSEAPELALRWVRERGSSAEPYANVLGLQLRLPLSSPPRATAELASKRGVLAELEAQRSLLREQIDRDAERARLDLDAGERSLALVEARKALVADTLQLMQKSFALGETDLPTLIRHRAEFFAVEAARVRQLRARSAAIAQLNQMQGVLP